MIKFNKRIYSQKAIEEAIRKFKGLVNLQLIEKNNYFIVKTKSGNKKMAEILKDEFSNYVLGLGREV